MVTHSEIQALTNHWNLVVSSRASPRTFANSDFVPWMCSPTTVTGASRDRIGCGSPDEWLRMAVRILDVVIDFLDQFFHTAKRSPAKSSLGNAVEPDLHLIEPGGVGWSEVYVEPWPCGEPASNSQMLVRGVIIHDDVHLQVLRYLLLNLPEKTQIFLMSVTRSTSREYFAVGRVQCGKQRGGSVRR